MITIIDYGRGNLFSLGQAIRHLGGEYHISSSADDITNAEKLLLPGVGAFGDGMQRLRDLGLVDAIQNAAERGIPVLGICLGMQLLANESEEFGRHKGLGLIQGTVHRLPSQAVKDVPVRIPNVGWRELNLVNHARERDVANSMYYFVHSYHFEPTAPNVVTGTIRYGESDVTAAVECDNIVGYQFHPEKSGEAGLDLVRAFLNR